MEKDYLNHINLVAKVLNSYQSLDQESPLKPDRFSAIEIQEDWENRCKQKGNNTFFFLMDLRNMKEASRLKGENETFNIYSSQDLNGKIMVNGADRFLDLEDGEILNHRKFLSLIHPAFRKLYLEQGAAGYQASITKEKRNIVQPLKHAHVTSIPLRVKPSLGRAQYQWAYQKAYAYQVNSANYLLSHLNEYIFLDPFDLKAERNIVMYFEEDGKAMPKLSIALNEFLRKRLFVNGDGFKDRDYLVLKGRADGKKYLEISEETGIPVGTIKTLNRGDGNRKGRMTQVMKRILGKEDLSSIDDIAKYLRQLKII